MTAKEIDQISNIVIDLLMEFQKEQNRLQIIYDNGSSRISEIEENIVNYKETEDVDFKVFSPRNISTLNEDKLESMDREKLTLMESNKEILKQLKYYNEKVEKLRTIQMIIGTEENEKSDFDYKDESIDDIQKVDTNEINDTDSTKTSIDINELIDNEFDKQSFINDLERLSHKMEISSKLIDNDIYRTKIELKSMKSNLDEIINSLK
ncbi:MAG: hypothetical protein Q4E51_07960 [Lachnospiraceae bacterium]|nr:hypothetical protein [Lachnospiraceae bacterium]